MFSRFTCEERRSDPIPLVSGVLCLAEDVDALSAQSLRLRRFLRLWRCLGVRAAGWFSAPFQLPEPLHCLYMRDQVCVRGIAGEAGGDGVGVAGDHFELVAAAEVGAGDAVQEGAQLTLDEGPPLAVGKDLEDVFGGPADGVRYLVGRGNDAHRRLDGLFGRLDLVAKAPPLREGERLELVELRLERA